jgi:hypothetical protein
VAHHLHQLAERVGEVPARAIADAADDVTEIAEDEARRATGDGRMSGMGRRGPKLRAVARVSSRSDSASAEVVGVPAGAWSILESGAAPHVIAPTRREGVLYSRGMRHAVRGPVRHPGAAGKRTWGRVVTRAEQLVPEVVGDELRDALR